MTPSFSLVVGGGGGKMVRGLAAALKPEQWVIVVNTGDDFSHLGLHISPDLDSVLYGCRCERFAARVGLAGETWSFMNALARFSDDVRFQLGDRDLALHVVRS